jgi:hypothetical protein
MDEWKGDKPVFLVIRQYFDHGPSSTVIDLDEGGWTTKYADLMRVPGVWMLCSKEASEKLGVLMPIFIMQVEEGDQPYFTMKHVGILSFGDVEGPESVTYGIGKKKPNGTVERLWLLPNGSTTINEDVYWVADRMNKGQL